MDALRAHLSELGGMISRFGDSNPLSVRSVSFDFRIDRIFRRYPSAFARCKRCDRVRSVRGVRDARDASEEAMISGAHSIIYSTNPDADRAFLRDVLALPNVDRRTRLADLRAAAGGGRRPSVSSKNNLARALLHVR